MEKKTKVVGLIPARGGSKSIPRKNIKTLGGHPLIAYSIVAGLQSKLIDRVIVSTDDEEIAEVSKRYGAEVPFLRPPELAQDHVTDLPVFEHAIGWLSQNEDYDAEVMVQIRPTSPFRPHDLIDNAIMDLITQEADCVRAITPSGENPYKMWKLQGNVIKPILDSDFEEPYNMPRQELPDTYWQTGHLDVISTRVIKENRSLTGSKILACHIDHQYAIDLDNLVQWEFAEFMMTKLGAKIVVPQGHKHAMKL